VNSSTHQEPRVPFDDPRVQIVYEVVCSDWNDPADKHWQQLSRRIVDALFPPPPPEVWTDWDGKGNCPAGELALIMVRVRSGQELLSCLNDTEYTARWNHHGRPPKDWDVVAYKLMEINIKYRPLGEGPFLLEKGTDPTGIAYIPNGPSPVAGS